MLTSNVLDGRQIHIEHTSKCCMFVVSSIHIEYSKSQFHPLYQPYVFVSYSISDILLMEFYSFGSLFFSNTDLFQLAYVL